MFVFLYIGIYLGDTDYDSSFNITQDKIDDFEEYLENNEYKTSYSNLNPNILNKTGKKVEDFIDKGFEVLFDIIKG